MSQRCLENGVYCEPGTTTPLTCPAGNYCTMGTKNVCAAGRYCPAGQGNNAGNMSGIFCPPGTYNSLRGQSSLSACLPCPAGKKCNNNYGTAVPDNCQPGEYCPGGTANPTSCPPGSYCPVDATNQPLGTMLDCPAGYMCSGSTSVPSNCGYGHYCPAKSSKRTQCPAGTYCPGQNSAAAIQCPAGSFCTAGSTGSSQCPPGTYCPAGSGQAINCTEDGTYCPPGSASPINCEPGWVCNNLHTQMGRSQCPSGRYCPGKTGPYSLQCPAGYDCRDSQISTLVGRECPAGFYCNAGTGELNTNGTKGPNYDPFECPRGHMCPKGSGLPKVCPKGTYTKGDRMGYKSTECLPCMAGKFCPGEGNYMYNDPELGPNRTSMTECPSGSYCPTGSIAAKKCAAGNYCPAGSSSDSVKCDKGPKNVSNFFTNFNCNNKRATNCNNITASTTACDSTSPVNNPTCPVFLGNQSTSFVKSSSCTIGGSLGAKVQRCVRDLCK